MRNVHTELHENMTFTLWMKLNSPKLKSSTFIVHVRCACILFNTDSCFSDMWISSGNYDTTCWDGWLWAAGTHRERYIAHVHGCTCLYEFENKEKTRLEYIRIMNSPKVANVLHASLLNCAIVDHVHVISCDSVLWCSLLPWTTFICWLQMTVSFTHHTMTSIFSCTHLPAGSWYQTPGETITTCPHSPLSIKRSWNLLPSSLVVWLHFIPVSHWTYCAQRITFVWLCLNWSLSA